MPIRVLLADSQPIYCAGLRHELGQSGSMDVVGEAVSGEEALALATQLQPDVLLLAVDIVGTPAFAVITSLRNRRPKTRVVALCPSADRDTIVRMLAASVSGLVLRGEPSALVTDAVEAAAAGSTWFSPALLDALAPHEAPRGADRPRPALSQRELQVLGLLARGEDNGGIARSLGVSERTVRYHLRSVCDKLSIGTRGELIAWAAATFAHDGGEASSLLS